MVSDKNFHVCSDCIHFEFQNYLQDGYDAKEGFCKLCKKFVTDVWETNCKYIKLNDTHEFICKFCKFSEPVENQIFYGAKFTTKYLCTKKNEYKNPDTYACVNFKKEIKRRIKWKDKNLN